MRHAPCLVFCCVLPCTLVSGCADFWDNVTSRDFSFGSLFTRGPAPLQVLKDSDDGSLRAKALASLQEPLQHGGTEQDQQVYVEILTRSAKADREPLCRLAAIKALGHFKDPRAAQCLRDVTEQNLTFTADLNNIIRQEALKSLADTGNPLAVEQLIRVAKEPPAEGATLDKQEVLDRRLTAIRGLGMYNYPQSTDTLLYLMEHERDAALHARAYASLKSATGKDLPDNAAAWTQALHPERGGLREGEGLASNPPNKVLDFLTWPIRLISGN
jgi:HEAT repeat protein